MDKKFMQRCIELAKCGFGTASPNPMVGAVITHNDRIIGEGWHKKCGEPHAEVNAVNSVKDKSLLCESTIYVSLEPCAHVGRTPACADMLIREGFKNVVIGSIDPFAKVAGKGIEKLQKAGVNVKLGVLKEECDWLNRRFFTYHTQQRPYIILKWAQTADGYIDNCRDEINQQPLLISNDYFSTINHKWRSTEDAILVGKNTVILDNPQLTTRRWTGRNPVRICLDRNLTLPLQCKIFDSQAKTIIINSKREEIVGNLHYHKIDYKKELVGQLLRVLYEEEIQSVIVEGGKQTIESFISCGSWDEAHVFESEQVIGNGVHAPEFNFQHQEMNFYKGQTHKTYYNTAYYNNKLKKNELARNR